jgi:DNA-directed RNA polymerase subunit RPC12/RpoP
MRGPEQQEADRYSRPAHGIHNADSQASARMSRRTRRYEAERLPAGRSEQPASSLLRQASVHRELQQRHGHRGAVQRRHVERLGRSPRRLLSARRREQQSARPAPELLGPGGVMRCPSCRHKGEFKGSKDFAARGQWPIPPPRAVRECRACGSGILVRPRFIVWGALCSSIPDEAWRAMRAQWERWESGADFDAEHGIRRYSLVLCPECGYPTAPEGTDFDRHLAEGCPEEGEAFPVPR